MRGMVEVERPGCEAKREHRCGRAGALVQCAVAKKTVSAAGTYNVTWTSTLIQGAQLWLAAVQ